MIPPHWFRLWLAVRGQANSWTEVDQGFYYVSILCHMDNESIAKDADLHINSSCLLLELKNKKIFSVDKKSDMVTD